jgi:hypothetical protein
MASDSTITELGTNPKATAKPADKVSNKLATVKVSGNDNQLSGEKMILTVAQGQGDGGGECVDVQVNGYLYQIPRGVPCEVPMEVVHILDNAVETKYDPAPGVNGEYKTREVPRFSYQARSL